MTNSFRQKSWGYFLGAASLFNRPSRAQPHFKPRIGNVESFSHFRKRGGDSSDSKITVVRFISGLLEIISPSAIRWLIIPIRIDSVQTLARRSFAHIRKKVLE